MIPTFLPRSACVASFAQVSSNSSPTSFHLSTRMHQTHYADAGHDILLTGFNAHLRHVPSFPPPPPGASPPKTRFAFLIVPVASKLRHYKSIGSLFGAAKLRNQPRVLARPPLDSPKPLPTGCRDAKHIDSQATEA